MNSILVFSPNGKIRLCFLNLLGSWYDIAHGDIAGICTKFEDVFAETKKIIIVDEAFSLLSYNVLIESSQTDPEGSGSFLIN